MFADVIVKALPSLALAPYKGVIIEVVRLVRRGQVEHDSDIWTNMACEGLCGTARSRGLQDDQVMSIKEN